MATRLYVMQGYPASGKSSKARELVRTVEDSVIVCRDDLRLMMHGEVWSGDIDKEQHVTFAENATVNRLLREGVTVILDATNLHPSRFYRWIQTARRLEVPLERVRVETPAQECITRDLGRAERGERAVGIKVIECMARDFPIGKWP